MAEWIGERTRDQVVAAFAEAEAACAPVYSMNEVLADPHVQARGSVAEIDGTPMQGLVARLSATPGRIRWAGRSEEHTSELQSLMRIAYAVVCLKHKKRHKSQE